MPTPIDWLDEHGITLHSVSSFGGASVKRIHRPVDGDGKTVSVGSYMIPLLQENCDKAGVQTLLNTTATEILTDANGAAVGVKLPVLPVKPSPSMPRLLCWLPAVSAQTWTWSLSTSLS